MRKGANGKLLETVKAMIEMGRSAEQISNDCQVQIDFIKDLMPNEPKVAEKAPEVAEEVPEAPKPKAKGRAKQK